MLDEQSKSDQGNTGKARCLIESGSPLPAVRLINTLLESAADNPKITATAHLTRGMAWQKMGKWTDAYGDFQASLKADSSNEIVYGKRSEVVLEYAREELANGRNESAIKVAKETLKDMDSTILLFPQQASWQLTRGQFCLLLSDSVEAAERERLLKLAHSDLSRVIDLGSNLASANRLRGLCSWRLGNRVDAAADFAMAASLSEESGNEIVAFLLPLLDESEDRQSAVLALRRVDSRKRGRLKTNARLLRGKTPRAIRGYERIKLLCRHGRSVSRRPNSRRQEASQTCRQREFDHAILTSHNCEITCTPSSNVNWRTPIPR